MFAVYPLDSETRAIARRKARASSEMLECRYCQRSFTKSYNLLIHERTHKQFNPNSNSNDQEDFQPSACDICGKMFKKVETMKNHRVSHSPPSIPKELKGFLTECVSY